MAPRSTACNLLPIDRPPPRKKAGDRHEASWSRSGCVTCKKRRKKCDEQKPRCGNCIRLGRECEGYATLWVTPLKPSAKTFRQEPSDSRRSKITSTSDQSDGVRQPPLSASYQPDCSIASHSSHLMPDSGPTTEGSVQDQNDEYDLTALTLSPGSKNATGYDLIRSPSQTLSSSELFYLQYHAEVGSKLLSNLETQHNPLKEVLIPLALSSPLLMNILCTMSARHMANWPSPNLENLRNVEMTYYGRTISGIRKALTQLPHQEEMDAPSKDLLDEIIVTVASVCKYEAVRGSVKSWRAHLEALQNLVAYRGGLASLDIGIADWLYGLVTYWQHMAKLTSPKLATGVVLCHGIYDSPKVDLYLGCSEQLVKLCSRISDLRFFANSATALIREVSEINDSLVIWSCKKQFFIIPKGISETAFERLKVVADYFRYAAFIFLHSIIDRISQSSLLSLEGPHSTFWSVVHSLVAFSKPAAVQNLLSLLRAVPPDNHPESSALVFPLFIAGCECEAHDQLALILGALHTLELNFGIHNTKRAQELLVSLSRLRAEGKWKHWLDLLEDVEWDLILV